MFFVGISAHLFIYLLVPAFLVVCFYFRGTAGSPEAVTLLPEVIVYESADVTSHTKTYVYQVEEQEEKCGQEQPEYPDCRQLTARFSPQVSFYRSPCLTDKSLRSPPFSC